MKYLICFENFWHYFERGVLEPKSRGSEVIMGFVKVLCQYEARNRGKQGQCKCQMVSHVVHAREWDHDATIVCAWIAQTYAQQQQALIQLIVVDYSSRSLFAHATRWFTGRVSQENIAISISYRQPVSYHNSRITGTLEES